ncbi:MAG: hypothetical protein K2X03_08405 [Bryobacteraceae bacterium]|nr:hypothetical protein [Bryobacteraceae bacterium]
MSYTYDSLGRLTQAATAGAGGWGMSWIYDGWGNRLNQTAVKGSVPTMVTLTDPATNRIQSHTYDANGNTISTPQQGTMTYDVQNRLKTVASDTYGYDPGNKRIWKNDEYTFWGANGERIGSYSAVKLIDTNGGTPVHTLVFQKIQTDEYFGGRRLTSQDRLGSVGSYYPYGESRSGTVSNADSFATYYRDSTGLDYADQRYYIPGAGRFASSDPYQASASASDPGSWNRYTSAGGEPIGRLDSAGLSWLPAGGLVTSGCIGCASAFGTLTSGGGGGGFVSSGSTPTWVWHEENEVLWGLDRLGYGQPVDIWQNTLDSLLIVANNIYIAGVSEECMKELSKLGNSGTSNKPITMSAISTAALSAQFRSGALPDVAVDFADPQVHALTINLGEPFIFWRPGQLGQSSTQSNWLANNVLHELLHTLGYSDAYIQETLLGKDKVDARNTNNITQHLGEHCFK